MTGTRLEGKVAIVTGGASGIGAATARAIVEQGGQVMIADVADEAAESFAAELGDAAAWAHLNVTDFPNWQTVVAATEERFGAVNVLANIAGIIERAPVEDLDLAVWDRTLAINLTGPLLGVKASLDALKRGKPSSVINMSSAAGLEGVSPQHAYTASKWGLRGLTKSLALQLSDTGIRVNSVHPGSIRTPMIAKDLAAYEEFLAGVTDLRIRPGRPEEVAAMIVFLASDESSFSTGSEFIVDGGYTAGQVVPE